MENNKEMMEKKEKSHIKRQNSGRGKLKRT